MDETPVHVLLVDDDEAATRSLIRGLEGRGATYAFHRAADATAALTAAARLSPHAAIVDLSLDPSAGPESGLSVIEALQQLDPTLRILVLTGHNAQEYGVEALHRGAASFIEKPADPVHLLALLKDAVSYTTLKRSWLSLPRTPEHLVAATGLSSRSPKMQHVLEQVAYAASNRQPLLLVGETGTGKGVIARAIHYASAARRGRFIRLQPSFSSPDLISSELFGHERGAFTGATTERKGLIVEAHEGTLFIDEVDELPHETQVTLLEVLQEGTFRRIGANREQRSSFRLIAATNRRVDEIVDGALLRPDFYHRIAHFTIEIPPLRERLEDIPDLASQLVTNIAAREHLPVAGLTAEGAAKLVRHRWPGNVRELQAVVEGGVYRANFNNRRLVDADDIIISAKSGAPTFGASFRERVRLFEDQLVRETLQRCGNNQSQAAELLQLDRSSLRRILKRSAST